MPPTLVIPIGAGSATSPFSFMLDDKVHNNNSEYLNALHNKMMNALYLLIKKNNDNPDMEILAKLLLTVWGRYEHDVSISEMMNNGDSCKNNEIIKSELNDYSDIEKCISDILKVV